MYLSLYNGLLRLASPMIERHLKKRISEGKEDEGRLDERMGEPSRNRPTGEVIWIHAASVGESISVLPLIEVLLAQKSDRNILLTTGSVTSANLMEDRLPSGAIHQFVPIDTKSAVHGFLNHWQPQIAIWTESEIWPNLITETARREIPMMLINARMTEQSFSMWRKTGGLIKRLLRKFDYIHAQSQLAADRLEYLGAKDIEVLGNLKFCSPPLPFNNELYRQMLSQTERRKVWLAASTHKGEEAIVAESHLNLKKSFKNLLTIIVPRHPERADEIASKLGEAGFNVSRRSQRQEITPETDIYLADTMGEMGLFYRIADVVFVGGSLVDKGGQNPLEPARLNSAIMFGPHMSNFNEIATDLMQNQAALQVKDGSELTTATYNLLSEVKIRGALAERADQVVKSGETVLGTLVVEIDKLLSGKD
ncbi:MAG: 3-deoxy-D-manno-octulosonic acid transferase [Sneathiella sp.]|nr:3-deoxy-D-manno-octulosonic acid transferase [Sneathiella sp.]